MPASDLFPANIGTSEADTCHLCDKITLYFVQDINTKIIENNRKNKCNNK